MSAFIIVSSRIIVDAHRYRWGVPWFLSRHHRVPGAAGWGGFHPVNSVRCRGTGPAPFWGGTPLLGAKAAPAGGPYPTCPASPRPSGTPLHEWRGAGGEAPRAATAGGGDHGATPS